MLKRFVVSCLSGAIEIALARREVSSLQQRPPDGTVEVELTRCVNHKIFTDHQSRHNAIYAAPVVLSYRIPVESCTVSHLDSASNGYLAIVVAYVSNQLFWERN